jgi:large subunit ribosomal protein L25
MSTAATVASATVVSGSFITLAKTLPPLLTRFFARYPPGTHTDVRSNPFKPTVHQATGKWHNPVFSLRRQAQLCKLARAHGVEELLPPSRKSSAEREERMRRRAERNSSGAARGVRGHAGERTLKARFGGELLFYIYIRIFYERALTETGAGWTGSRCARRLCKRCPRLSRSGRGAGTGGGGRIGPAGRRSFRSAHARARGVCDTWWMMGGEEKRCVRFFYLAGKIIPHLSSLLFLCFCFRSFGGLVYSSCRFV